MRHIWLLDALDGWIFNWRILWGGKEVWPWVWWVTETHTSDLVLLKLSPSLLRHFIRLLLLWIQRILLLRVVEIYIKWIEGGFGLYCTHIVDLIDINPWVLGSNFNIFAWNLPAFLLSWQNLFLKSDLTCKLLFALLIYVILLSINNILTFLISLRDHALGVKISDDNRLWWNIILRAASHLLLHQLNWPLNFEIVWMILGYVSNTDSTLS